MEYSIVLDQIRLIPFSKYENNFVFIVNNKKYYTNRILADILSPIIRSFHFVDESISEYSFNIDEEIDLFPEFLQLAQFNKVELDQKHIQCFSKYFLMLGNIIEFINLNKNIFYIDNDDLIQICFELYQKYSTAMPCDLIERINDLFAENFYKINNLKKLRDFDLDFLEGIVSSQSLILNDEDSFLNCILDLYEEDHIYSRLFEYIYFTNVGDDTLHRFFETFSYQDINQSLWQSIVSIFLEKDEKIIKNEKRYWKKIEKQVIFLGDENCGKTSIIKNKLNGKCDIYCSDVCPKKYDIKFQNVNLNVYDTPGQKMYKCILLQYLRYNDVFVVVYDVNQKDVNSYLNEWIQFIEDIIKINNQKIFIVCNKIDLVCDDFEDLNNENIEKGREFAKKHNYHFNAISARNNYGIEELFDEIAK